MKAIQTKYLGRTNTRGARVKAFAGDGDRMPPSVVVPWDYNLDTTENHRAAALALAEQMGWSGEWVGGSTVDGYSFVNSEAGPTFQVLR